MPPPSRYFYFLFFSPTKENTPSGVFFRSFGARADASMPVIVGVNVNHVMFFYWLLLLFLPLLIFPSLTTLTSRRYIFFLPCFLFPFFYSLFFAVLPSPSHLLRRCPRVSRLARHLHQPRHVLLHRLLLGHVNNGVACIPLRTGLKLHRPRLRARDRTLRCLLEQCVELQLHRVGQLHGTILRERSHVTHGSLKLSLGHYRLPTFFLFYLFVCVFPFFTWLMDFSSLTRRFTARDRKTDRVNE
ncbi:hypothetical protein MOQ_007727 [Trypanosoma cruzi marinkellei]|uniref:Uncharacterized protein n=1 Tax=Trypanosoma cruzi marinkellei TaxID=85056 RepID=K2M0S4_TRYCR|nr:hypothetical protein MOQ_007727 [Trypanosoma cruzi marinkellei]